LGDDAECEDENPVYPVKIEKENVPYTLEECGIEGEGKGEDRVFPRMDEAPPGDPIEEKPSACNNEGNHQHRKVSVPGTTQGKVLYDSGFQPALYDKRSPYRHNPDKGTLLAQQCEGCENRVENVVSFQEVVVRGDDEGADHDIEVGVDEYCDKEGRDNQEPTGDCGDLRIEN
jgi:hypothetical protein